MAHDLVELRKIFTSALASDCLDKLGYGRQVLNEDINMISGSGIMMGYAFPVKLAIVNSFPDSEDQDTLTEIAEALDIELTKEITWSATIHVSGTMQVPLSDNDFESELADNLFVDSQNGDIEIDDYQVSNIEESY